MTKLIAPVIFAAFGALAAIGPTSTKPDQKLALSATIYGPSSVKPYSTCMWEGTASGGTEPYEYSWMTSQGDYGYGTTFTATAPGSAPMYVYLTVRDAIIDNEVTVRKTVYVSQSAPVCIAN